jgi:hypothetical protein
MATYEPDQAIDAQRGIAQRGIYVKVSPSEDVHIAPGKNQKFTAVVTGDPSNAGVKWDIAQGGGEMSPEGLYTPPTTPGHATISATSKADTTKVAEVLVNF